LHSVLTAALADPHLRAQLRDILGGWALTSGDNAAPESWRPAQILAKALAAAGNLSAADVAAWLDLCVKRRAKEKADAWISVAATVLDAASASGLAGDAALLEPVRRTLQGTGKGAAKDAAWAPLARKLDAKIHAGR
jgi:hypothetical protein